MAKDGKGKKNKGGKSAIPKEIGGVKVPKKLRKLGGKAVKAASDPVVSEVVAGALLAAAAALREGKDPKSALGAGFKGGVQTAKDGARQEAGRLSDALKGLAIDIAKRTFESIKEQNARAPEAPHVAAEVPQADAPESPPQPDPKPRRKAPAERMN
ncbi:MAG TPA: hypothetical protein VIA98_08330 [Allosphingosinicella sp.]|jgi:hypothetical protein